MGDSNSISDVKLNMTRLVIITDLCLCFRHLPDDVLRKACAEAGYDNAVTEERAQINVWSPSVKYGTR